ncbi:MAG: hypothetical protein KTR14_00090 [Vampirovibrio sp.]|nr:hypothetical protein [Vampirovibrio sp.]
MKLWSLFKRDKKEEKGKTQAKGSKRSKGGPLFGGWVANDSDHESISDGQTDVLLDTASSPFPDSAHSDASLTLDDMNFDPEAHNNANGPDMDEVELEALLSMDSLPPIEGNHSEVSEVEDHTLNSTDLELDTGMNLSGDANTTVNMTPGISEEIPSISETSFDLTDSLQELTMSDDSDISSDPLADLGFSNQSDSQELFDQTLLDQDPFDLAATASDSPSESASEMSLELSSPEESSMIELSDPTATTQEFPEVSGIDDLYPPTATTDAPEVQSSLLQETEDAELALEAPDLDVFEPPEPENSLGMSLEMDLAQTLEDNEDNSEGDNIFNLVDEELFEESPQEELVTKLVEEANISPAITSDTNDNFAGSIEHPDADNPDTTLDLTSTTSDDETPLELSTNAEADTEVESFNLILEDGVTDTAEEDLSDLYPDETLLAVDPDGMSQTEEDLESTDQIEPLPLTETASIEEAEDYAPPSQELNELMEAAMSSMDSQAPIDPQEVAVEYENLSAAIVLEEESDNEDKPLFIEDSEPDIETVTEINPTVDEPVSAPTLQPVAQDIPISSPAPKDMAAKKTVSLADSMIDFEINIILNDARFVNDSINHLVNRYFEVNQGET